MKKKEIYSFAIVLFFSGINAFAQLKVDSLGRVGIGANPANYSLKIGGAGRNGLYVENDHSASGGITGINIMGTGTNTSLYSYGLYSATGVSSTQNVAICGMIPGLPGGQYPISHMTAILGSSGMSTSMIHSGVYAGYFLGDMRVTGITYAYLMSPSSITSSSDVSVMSEESGGARITDMLSKINTLKVLNKTEPQLLQIDQTSRYNLMEGGYDVPEYVESSDSPLPSTRYELDYDQLIKMFPELGYKDDDGNACINYIEMIPLLLQSIKELNTRIKDLEEKLGNK